MISMLGAGCKKNSDPVPTGNDPDPQITGISPQSGPVGANVTISGTDLSSETSDLSVSFNGTESDILSSTLTSIQTTVPEGATSGVVSVTVRGTTINGPSFTVEEPTPQISSITPDTAFVGDQVTIRGNNFGEDSTEVSVIMSNITANVLQFSDSLIIAEVVNPEGDTGPIDVEVIVNNISSQIYNEFNILRIKSVATGEFHSCAITLEGNVYCWGENEQGQLGNDTTIDSVYPVPVENPNGVTFTDIVAARYHTLAVDENGQVWGWGSNSAGQLGVGTSVNSTVPVMVQGLDGISIEKVSTGIAHTLALDTNGQIWAWGNNSSGRLGDGTETDRLSPVQVSGPQNVVFNDVAAGVYHSVALDKDGQAWAWGNNAFGKLGDGTTVNRLVPTAVMMPTNVSFTNVAGGSDHTIALSSTDGVWAWGSNEIAQLGSGSMLSSATPVQVDFAVGSQIKTIMTGHYHNLAITSENELWGWGSSSSGRLGAGFTGATVEVPTALQTPENTGFYLLSANRNHSLVISLGSSKVYAWGGNDNGQLGNGTTASVQSTLQQVVFNVE